MRRMRPSAQSVEKQNVQATQPLERRLRNIAEVGEVSRGAEAVAMDLILTVHDGNRFKACSVQFDGPVDFLQLDLSLAAVLVIALKDVVKDVLQPANHRRMRIEK